MSNIKSILLFLLKSFVFSAIFMFMAFVLYSIPSSSNKHMSNKANTVDIQEYNHQIAEYAKALEQQKELVKRVDANITAEERNIKRMSAILDLWERQAKKAK